LASRAKAVVAVVALHEAFEEEELGEVVLDVVLELVGELGVAAEGVPE
jgi:hypothetical protein